MKKLILLFAVLAALNSCKKTYTCSCSTIVAPNTPTHSFTVQAPNAGEANNLCQSEALSGENCANTTVN